MNRLLIIPAMLVIASVCQAGYFEISQSSYTATQYINVVEGGTADNLLSAGDLVRTVQYFNYTDDNGVGRNALAISITQVTSTTSSGRVVSTFGKPGAGGSVPTSTAPTSVSGITVVNGGALDSVFAGASLSDASFVMLSRAAGTNTNIGQTGFDFTAANFGLSGWNAEFYAQFNGSDYQQYVGAPHPISPIGLDPVTQYGGFYTPGNATGSALAFGFDISFVHDENSTYTADSGGIGFQTFDKNSNLSSPQGSFTANIGTASSYSIAVAAASGVPTGSVYTASSVTVNIPNPSTVPEPGSILVLSAVGFAGLAARRRRS